MIPSRVVVFDDDAFQIGCLWYDVFQSGLHVVALPFPSTPPRTGDLEVLTVDTLQTTVNDVSYAVFVVVCTVKRHR